MKNSDNQCQSEGYKIYEIGGNGYEYYLEVPG